MTKLGFERQNLSQMIWAPVAPWLLLTQNGATFSGR